MRYLFQKFFYYYCYYYYLLFRGTKDYRRFLLHLYGGSFFSIDPNLQVVVMVGKSLSGQDLSMEIVEVAKDVYISTRSNVSEGLSKVISKHDNLHLRPEVFPTFMYFFLSFLAYI